MKEYYKESRKRGISNRR